jgi:hypothetical protein
MDTTRAVAITVIVLVVAWLLLMARKGAETAEIEDDLLSLCHGDKERMERLTQLELSKDPKLSRRDAMARAAAFLRRDSR